MSRVRRDFSVSVRCPHRLHLLQGAKVWCHPGMVPDASEHVPPNRRSRLLTRRRLVVGVLVVTVIIVATLSFWKSEPPAVVLLPPSATFKHDPLPDRWIPRSWGWAWKARDRVFGKRRPVNLQPRIMKFIGPLSQPDYLPPPTFRTNGLQIWILGASEFDALGPRLLQTTGLKSSTFFPFIRTADGVVASAFSGQAVPVQGGGFTNAGLTFQVLPLVGRDKIDLTFTLGLTEMAEGFTSTKLGETNSFPTVRTAFWQTLRAQIPRGRGLVLLQDPAEGRAGVVMLLFVEAK
jgi:hypothetical protein